MTRHHGPSTPAPRCVAVLVLCSAVALALAGCTESRAAPFDTAVSPEQPSSFVDAPRGTEADPLGGLPVTDSTDRLLVSTLDLDEDTAPHQRLLDLGRGTTSEFATGPDSSPAAFTSTGDIVRVVEPRTVERLSATTGTRASFELPPEVGGWITRMDLVDDRVVLDVSGDQGSQTVVVTLDGGLQCAGPAGTEFTPLTADLLWSWTLDARLDPATCSVSQPLLLPGPSTAQPIVANGTDLYAAVGAQDELGVVDRGTMARFDLPTGRVIATSERVGRSVSDAVLHDGDLWVLADGHVLRLHPETLEIRSHEELSPGAVDCGFPFFVRSAGELFVVDDCSLVLYLIDTGDGRSRQGWVFPSDGVSDSEISATVSTEGIWLVDVEQTGVPYMFDPAQRRFERLPLSTADQRDIYALDFRVHPRPDD